MATNKIQTGLRLEDEALRKITYIAKQQRRSLNAEIELAVDKAIRDYESEYGRIQIDN
jgi:hypothetical protein